MEGCAVLGRLRNNWVSVSLDTVPLIFRRMPPLWDGCFGRPGALLSSSAFLHPTMVG